VIALIAPFLLPLFLGAGWNDAGVFAQALMPLTFVSFVVGPVNMALTIAGKQVHQLYWDVGRCFAVFGTWAFIIQQRWNAIDAIWLHATVGVICYVSYLLIADRALRYSAKIARSEG
jgi:O-antigen/teichoic acid export membrane protein